MGQVANSLQLCEREASKLRLAALLHDIGQYPLSHVIEFVYRTIGDQTHLEAGVANPEELEQLDQINGRALSAGEIATPADADNWLQPVSWSTAVRSEGFATDKDLARNVITRRPDLQQIFAKFGYSPTDVQEIAQIATGTTDNILYTQLMDSVYDCDRLDYVPRDASETGVHYGHIDLSYLIEHMSIMTEPAEGGRRVLAIDKRRSLHSLEQYLTGRYYMYSQIIHNKDVKGIEILAKSIYLRLAKEGKVYRSFAEILSIVDTPKFLMFNDVYFYSALYEYFEEAGGEDSTDRLAQMIRRLLFWSRASAGEPIPLVLEWRKLWDRERPGADDEYSRVRRLLFEKPREFAEVCRSSGVDPAAVVIEEIPVDFLPLGRNVLSKDILAGAQGDLAPRFRRFPRLRDDARPNQPQFILDEPSSILPILAKLELRITRIYALESDTDALARLRAAIRDTL
jgi:hypothetical protein